MANIDSRQEIFSNLDLLEQLGRLKANGVISEDEFTQKKAVILKRISLAINPDYEMEQAAKLRAEEEEAARKAAEAAEEEKRARYEHYWAEHSEERVALEKKRAEAQEKIRLLGRSAKEEREKIQDFINAIDDELKKER